MAAKNNLLVVDKPVYRTYEDYPPEDLYLYAGFDCIVTSELASALAPRCEVEPPYTRCIKGGVKVPGSAMSIFESYERFTKPAFEFIVDLEINGIKYDVEGNRRMAERMVREVAELEEEIFREIPAINLDSGAAMAEFLYVTKGFEVESRTKTGEPSTDGDALKALSEKYDLPWLATIGKRKDIVSIYRTFIENYVKDFVKPDGKIHSSYNLHGTSSFRISGDNPNFTQIPRPKWGYNIRDLFIPEEGNVFICLDFSSAEVKILGAISRDPALLQAIADGLDFHSFSASQMKGIPYDDFMEAINDKTHECHKLYKLYRQQSKALTFGILYGSTAGGVALNLGISYAEAEALINLYFSKFPRIKEYIENVHNEAIWNHMGVGPFGQRKMQYGTLPCFKGTAVWNAALRNQQNVRIQGTSSSAGLACFAAGNNGIKSLGGRSLATVYDSWELECPREHAAEVLEMAFYYMEEWPLKEFDWLTLPIGVEAEISGKSWGQCSVIHRGSTQAQIEEFLKKEQG